jgi:hypothetical protein
VRERVVWSPASSGYIRSQNVDLVLILVLAGVAVAGTFAIAAALAAGDSDRAAEGSADERAAIWQAGFSPHDLRVLAGLAAVARVDLSATGVEIVLRRGQAGLVVTGSRLPPGRLGARVAVGEGVAGRALAGRTIVAERAIAAPIGPVGVIVAFGDLVQADASRLEALAGEAASRLDISVADVRDAG